TCGPFTDVAADSFCPFVQEVFYLAVTTGTNPTTFDPSASVSRLQMAAFLSRSVDRVLQRGSRRAALNQFWTAGNRTTARPINLDVTTTGPTLLQSDGADVWVANNVTGTVSRVRASDSRVLETWTGATGAYGVLAAGGFIYVTGYTSPGKLYEIDPMKPPGAVFTYATPLGNLPLQIAFDGATIFTANFGGSVSLFNKNNFAGGTVTTGFTSPYGIVYDGSNMWVTEVTIGRLQKLDSLAAILQTVTVGSQPRFPVFDGSNIWVPNFGSNSISIVRASSGVVLATLTGNGLNGPVSGAFDGQRVLITNFSGDSVSLWKAADLTTIANVALDAGSHPNGACSDGLNFWLALYGNLGQIARF
ncbi:MAG TPA: S-layer homology domain-containing protein, partial [Thermoanaerobaculia bacterium]|nr:S-layer homology domain-containing protein [Thermoanaerobaculia bacterium]